MVGESIPYRYVEKGSSRIRIFIITHADPDLEIVCHVDRVWLEPEPSLWPGPGSTLYIWIIHAKYMELNLI